MALAIRPHTLVMTAREKVRGNSPETTVVVTYKNGSTTVTIKGQLTPMTPAKAFGDFNVEATRPHLWLCNPGNEDNLRLGDYGTCQGRKFLVASAVQIWNAETSTACNAVVLDEQI